MRGGGCFYFFYQPILLLFLKQKEKGRVALGVTRPFLDVFEFWVDVFGL